MEENEKLEFDGKVKQWLKKTNLKWLLKSSSFCVGVILVVVMSVANIVFDSTNFSWEQYITNTILIIFIEVFGLLIGESMSIDKQEVKVNGLYQNNIQEFDAINRKVSTVQEQLDDYLLVLQESEQRIQEIKVLAKYGIRHGEQIILMSESELEQLHKEAKNIRGIDHRKLNDKQYEIAVGIINGAVQVNSVDASYFTNENNNVISGAPLDRAVEFDKTITKHKRRTRISKILLSVIIGMVWSILTVKDFMDATNAQAWVNLISRIFALITSFASGWGSGVVTVKIEADKISYKTTILTWFYNAIFVAKTFNPKSLDEKAHQEVVEAEKKHKEREVEVELVQQNTPLQIEIKGNK